MMTLAMPLVQYLAQRWIIIIAIEAGNVDL